MVFIGVLGASMSTANGAMLVMSVVAARNMFERYQQWAVRQGLRCPLTQRTLTKRLRERGMQLQKTNGRRIWEGVALK